MKFLRYIICSLTLATLLPFGACTDEMRVEADSEIFSPADDDGMVDLNISFALEDEGSFATRDDNDNFVEFDINNIDLLVYSLRDSADNVLYQYGQGIVDEELKSAKALENYIETTDNNQTLMKPVWDGNNKMSITLRVMRGTVYKLSVWAQNRECEAYDFNYLTAVKVDYDKMNMNDVSADAFCATSIFSIGQVNSNVSVTLTRPFAQVKVGMLWDENETDDSKNNVKNNPGYTQSALSLEGVAKFFNVVENRTWTKEEISKVLDENDNSYGNNYNEHIFQTAKKNADGSIEYTDIFPDKNNITVTQKVNFRMAALPSGSNEYFTVHNYSGWTTGNPTSVTFKNLAMCYVLVPETTFETDGNGNYVENGGSADDGDIRWVTCKNGNTVKVQYNTTTKTWSVVKVLDENYVDITTTAQDKYQSWNWDDVTYYWLRDKDGNYVKLNEKGEFEKVIIENKDQEEEDYVYDPDYMDDMNVVYPGTPNDSEVTLQLLSLSFKDGSGNDKNYSPSDLKIRVKRNWRSNLLFDTWTQITSSTE